MVALHKDSWGGRRGDQGRSHYRLLSRRPMQHLVVIAGNLRCDYPGRVPKTEEIDQAFTLARVLYKSVLGLHYKRQEQKKNGQMAIFSAIFGDLLRAVISI